MGAKEPERVLASVVSEDTRAVRDFISSSRAAGVRVAAACTSTFLLAEAGVLTGLTATTSWWLGPVFRKRYPAVRLDETRMLVSENGITTAGAALGHVDLALSIVMSRSPALAESVARHLLIDFRASQAAYAMPTLLASHHPLVAEFERWLRAHLDEPVTIARAAGALGVSERTLQRSVADTLGMSPMDFVQELRIDRSIHLLRTTTLAAEVIARRVGYHNAATLRQLMRRRRNTTLSAIRRRHAIALTSTRPLPARSG
jgi:transcriptional regulator GlxA family with amidase domain